MGGYKLLYVHGYCGHANGNAATLIRNEIEKRKLPITVDAPAFNVTDPDEMRKMLDEYANSNEYMCVAASSLGAFYVMQSSFPKKILINTAMPDDLKKIRDKDPVGNTKITEELLRELEKEKEEFLKRERDQAWRSNTYMIFGTKDDVAHNEDILVPLVDKGNVFHVEMGHRMETVGVEIVCDVLREIIKK